MSLAGTTKPMASGEHEQEHDHGHGKKDGARKLTCRVLHVLHMNGVHLHASVEEEDGSGKHYGAYLGEVRKNDS